MFHFPYNRRCYKIKLWITSYILELIIFCNGINEPVQQTYKSVEDWSQKLNDELLTMNQYTAFYAWQSSINATPALSQSLAEFNQLKNKWIDTRCSEIADFPRNIDETYNRMMDILCRGPKFSEIESHTLTVLLSAMQEIFTETRICIPKFLDLCTNLHQIWEFTFVKYSDEPLHRIAVKKDSINYQRIYVDQGINGELGENFLCFNGEPDLERIMAGDLSQLSHRKNDCVLKYNEIFRWAWESWRLTVGNKIFEIYPTFVEYMNVGAKRNGYSDIGEEWREEDEIPNLRNVVNSLNNVVKPFYKLLHGVVRNVLWKRVHKFEPFSKNQTIPAHLLGSMWGDDWKPYEKLIIPFNEVDLDENLKNTNWTSIDMVRRADDFYSSMGIPGMSKTFWEKSVFQKNSADVKCHGTAANMFIQDDFRMLVCPELTLEDFYVIVHEMGHIHYYMAYEKQPAIFRDGNSALQESIGDAIFLAMMTPQHLNRLKLLPDKYLYTETLSKFSQSFQNMVHSHKPNNEFLEFSNDVSDEKENSSKERPNIFGKSYPKISERIAKMRKYQNFTSRFDGLMNSFDLSLLLKQALATIPQIPFSYILDVFRWDLFSGDVSFDEANTYFWKLIISEQGLHPPDWENRKSFFDPGAKYHIADNTPYVRYFLASFIQAQVFHGLCLATVFGEIKLEQKLPMPLHRCDLYGSKRAGKLLQKALKIGTSKPWTETLFILTGSRTVKADSLLLYYEPLIEWLENLAIEYNIPVGW